MANDGLKFGSLFSGVGGFDLGFERAGMKCIWQVEFDKACQSILKKHWSETELFDDVRTVGKHNLKPVELICGGFPCQDISIAGKRKGLDGERSGLWFEFARIIDELEPKWVVIENVPGLLSSNRGRDFAVIIRWLAERGYGVAWRVFDSQYFGVAQRRRRVFIVGSFGNGSAAKILFESEGVRWDIEKGRKTGEDIAGTITDRVGESGSGWARWNEAEGLVSKSMVMSSGQTNAEIMNECSSTLTGLHEQPILAVAYENHPADSRITETGDISQQLTSRMGTGGGNVPLVQEFCIPLKDMTVLDASESRRQNGVGEENGKSFTLRGGLQPGVGLQSGVRRLTPTEYERLQGFPDGWTDGQADSHRYKQMGNAVTVNVAEWIGKRIVEANKEYLKESE